MAAAKRCCKRRSAGLLPGGWAVRLVRLSAGCSSAGDDAHPPAVSASCPVQEGDAYEFATPVDILGPLGKAQLTCDDDPPVPFWEAAEHKKWGLRKVRWHILWWCDSSVVEVFGRSSSPVFGRLRQGACYFSFHLHRARDPPHVFCILRPAWPGRDGQGEGAGQHATAGAR